MLSIVNGLNQEKLIIHEQSKQFQKGVGVTIKILIKQLQKSLMCPALLMPDTTENQFYPFTSKL